MKQSPLKSPLDKLSALTQSPLFNPKSQNSLDSRHFHGHKNFDELAKQTAPHPKNAALFSPIKVGHTTLKNRIVMGSMHTGLEDWFWDFGKLATFYEARAKAGVGLIVTGGFSPNHQGKLTPFAGSISQKTDIAAHMLVTRAVHKHGGKILIQLLHSGRYGYHPFVVAPSPIKSPISPFKPRQMSETLIEKTIQDFANSAKIAKDAGYDGVEIMGSEGYLINQFLATHSNERTDAYGGAFSARCQFALNVVKAVRAAVGEDFIIGFRLSMIDLIKNGNTMADTIAFAKALEDAGVNLINTGIGWHEARVPTIITSVPRASFSRYSHAIKTALRIPVIGANRINMPDTATTLIKDGTVDLIQMARPFLADSEWVLKAYLGEDDAINTCIACNQACLDHTFENKKASCLVNPAACNEDDFVLIKAKKPKRIAVIGGGVAGMTAALIAQKRGHQVTIFEAKDSLGGQFNFAKVITGKEEFFETLRYYRHELAHYGVEIRLNTAVDKAFLAQEKFDSVVVATGISPRQISLEKTEHSPIKIMDYSELLSGKAVAGERVAILGAGGIGYDVAEFLATKHHHDPNINHPDYRPTLPTPEEFLSTWGVDKNPHYDSQGGLVTPTPHAPLRQIYLLQRSDGKFGASLGKTTGWVHRASLKQMGVILMGGVRYDKVDNEGLWVIKDGQKQLLRVDTIVICAGQESVNTLMPDIGESPTDFHIIGGAKNAERIDAKRAIKEGYELGLRL